MDGLNPSLAVLVGSLIGQRVRNALLELCTLQYEWFGYDDHKAPSQPYHRPWCNHNARRSGISLYQNGFVLHISSASALRPSHSDIPQNGDIQTDIISSSSYSPGSYRRAHLVFTCSCSLEVPGCGLVKTMRSACLHVYLWMRSREDPG